MLAHNQIQNQFTHDILLLLELVRTSGVDLMENADDLALLTPFAAAWRYDDPLQESVSIESDWMLKRVAATVAWAEAILEHEKGR